MCRCCFSALAMAFLSNAASRVSTTENESFCRSRAVLFWDTVVAGAKLYMLFYCSSRFLRGGFLFLKHCRSLITPLVAFGMPVTAKFNAGLGGFKTKCKIIAQKQFFFLLVRLEMSLLSNTGVGSKPWDCLLIPT